MCERKPGLGATFTQSSPALSAPCRTGTALLRLQPQGLVRAWRASWDAGPRPQAPGQPLKHSLARPGSMGPAGTSSSAGQVRGLSAPPWTGSRGSSDKCQPHRAAALEPGVELAHSSPQRLGVEASFRGAPAGGESSSNQLYGWRELRAGREAQGPFQAEVPAGRGWGRGQAVESRGNRGAVSPALPSWPRPQAPDTPVSGGQPFAEPW